QHARVALLEQGDAEQLRRAARRLTRERQRQRELLLRSESGPRAGQLGVDRALDLAVIDALAALPAGKSRESARGRLAHGGLARGQRIQERVGGFAGAETLQNQCDTASAVDVRGFVDQYAGQLRLDAGPERG